VTPYLHILTTEGASSSEIQTYLHHDKTFGHVKAQKILHLVEAEADFDLGRTPIKDAAGPTTFRICWRRRNGQKRASIFASLESRAVAINS